MPVCVLHVNHSKQGLIASLRLHMRVWECCYVRTKSLHSMVKDLSRYAVACFSFQSNNVMNPFGRFVYVGNIIISQLLQMKHVLAKVDKSHFAVLRKSHLKF